MYNSQFESAPPMPDKLWLRVLYAFYKATPESPITPRQLFEGIYNKYIGVTKLPNLRASIMDLYRYGYLYRFGDIAWKGYAYMINLYGLTKLHRRGLISSKEEQNARKIILSKLEEIDPDKYRRIVNRLKRY